MATLDFKDFDLNQTTITGKRNPVVELDAWRERYKVDSETKQRTDVVEGYVADIVARNRIQSVKLPVDAVNEETVKRIKSALEAHKVVKINFGTTASTLRGRCYALLNSGQLIKGVSCTATELNIVAIDEPEADDFDDYEINLD